MYYSLTKTKNYPELETQIASANAILKCYKSSSLLTCDGSKLFFLKLTLSKQCHRWDLHFHVRKKKNKNCQSTLANQTEFCFCHL